jgi:hypothetical protein
VGAVDAVFAQAFGGMRSEFFRQSRKGRKVLKSSKRIISRKGAKAQRFEE